MQREVPATAWAAWLNHRVERYDAEIVREAHLAGATPPTPPGGAARIAEDLGMHQRHFYRHRRAFKHTADEPTDTYPIELIQRALDNADIPINTLRDELIELGIPGAEAFTEDEPPDVLPITAWCPTCRELATPTIEGLCIWCDTDTGARPTDLIEHRIVDRGWLTPDLVNDARRAYLQGESMYDIGRRLVDQTPYANYKSLANQLREAFIRRGWALRDSVAVTRARNWRHGHAQRDNRAGYKSWYRREHGLLQARCVALKVQAPGAGSRCQRPSMPGSMYCANHDPGRHARLVAQLAEMRGRITEPMLPLEPFARWLEQRRDHYGTNRALAAAIGMDPSILGRLLRRQKDGRTPKTTIRRKTVLRILMADGSARLDDIYTVNDTTDLAA